MEERGGDRKARVVRAVKTEIYSRVVGYYRPVQDWNRGKREEFRDREYVRMDGEDQATSSSRDS